MYDCILLRYGEVALKSKRKRPMFEKAYTKSIAEALRRVGIENFLIRNLGGRFVVETCAVQDACDALSCVPGVQSLSPAKKVEFKEVPSLLDRLTSIARPWVAGKVFVVRVKRVGKHDFTSIELGASLGERLMECAKGVSFSNPEVTVGVEVRDGAAYVFRSSIQGVGGLPATTGGKVLALFSGGIDSPVAAFELLKRGCQVDFLLVNLMGESAFNDVAKVYNFLSNRYCFGYKPRLFVFDGRELASEIQERVPDRLRQLALKICLYTLAQDLAREQGHLAIATGEALSQKSSQTLESLRFIESQVSLPVLRPLLCRDKVDITALARKIGTFASSQRVKEYCNLSKGPVLTVPDESTLAQMPALDSLTRLSQQKLSVFKGFVEIDESSVPEGLLEGAIVIDLRPAPLRAARPIGCGEEMSYAQALESVDSFDPAKKYLFVCDFGVRSEDVAFLLRKRGVKAAGVGLRQFLKYFSS